MWGDEHCKGLDLKWGGTKFQKVMEGASSLTQLGATGFKKGCPPVVKVLPKADGMQRRFLKFCTVAKTWVLGWGQCLGWLYPWLWGPGGERGDCISFLTHFSLLPDLSVSASQSAESSAATTTAGTGVFKMGRFQVRDVTLELLLKWELI